MPFAVLTADGRIRQTLAKLTPGATLAEGERIVACNPPEIDPELQTFAPVLPVPPEAQAVEFVVADKPGALDALKARRWAEIKASREAEKVAPELVTPWGPIDSDAKGIDNLKGALHGLRSLKDLSLPTPVLAWTMRDNTVAQLDMLKLDQIAVMLLQRADAAHQHARALRTQINQATTMAEVLAVRWGP